MTRTFRMSYYYKVFRRYHRSSKHAKSRILDELCKVCGYHRKWAIQKLAQPFDGFPTKVASPPPRPAIYSPELLKIIETVWEEAGYPWSVRLKEILRLWEPWIRQRFPLTPRQIAQLQRISARTLDYRLQSKKRRLKKRLYGHTKPGGLLKHQIPIRTEHWDIQRPGFLEMDLVAHCGSSAEGEFLYSLNVTDIYSGWVETRAVSGKGEMTILEALQDIQATLPFPLRGLDSDNGSEFINKSLLAWCQSHRIQFTRSRPYKKDDNAHIEQKNWTHVRKLLGWLRYDTPNAQAAINSLYRQDLRHWMNLFQPSVRLQSTQRVGSRLRRRYSAPKTPLDRLLLSRFLDPRPLRPLQALRQTTNPFDLSTRVQDQLQKIARLAQHRTPQRQPQYQDFQQREVAAMVGRLWGFNLRVPTQINPSRQLR
jgi:transposase InsO family protein